MLAAGASIGAFNALGLRVPAPRRVPRRDLHERHVRPAPLLRRPGRRRLRRVVAARLRSRTSTSEHLDRLRTRFVVLASGEGANEDIGESWHAAHVLGGGGIPNRVDPWGRQWPHDWPSWRAMLPGYLDELVVD